MPQFTKLGSTNYPTWAGEMQAWLCANSVLRIVSGNSKAPTLSSPPTDAQIASFDAWTAKSDKAAGYLYVSLLNSSSS